MKHLIVPLILFLFVFLHEGKSQNAPPLAWQKCLGGADSDYGEFAQLTSDGGYLVTGSSKSLNGDVSGNHGIYDFWVARLDSAGNILWQKSYGGSETDLARSIVQLSDGSFAIAGYKISDDGDASFSHGGYDMWLMKIDSAGNLLWENSYGGANEDDCFDVIATSDQGFLLTGATWSLDGDITNQHGGIDGWLVKVDASGDLEWQKTFGGSSDEYFYHTLQTGDGGFISAGFTSSGNGDVSNLIGVTDVWVVKMDASGNIEWEQTYGGTLDDRSYSIAALTNGNFVVAGKTASNDHDVSGNHGAYDLWAICIDDSGNLLWQKCVGGTSTEYAWDVSSASGNGCIISGETFSNNGDITSTHGAGDAWLVRVDSSGNLLWNGTFGGNNEEWARRVVQDDAGYFISMCRTLTQNNGDVSGGHGSDEYWLIKINPECANYTVPDFTFIQNGSAFTFSDASLNATSISWDFGDGTTSTDPNPMHQYASNGVYNVCLTATGSCNTTTTCQTVTTCGSLISDFTFAPNGLTVQFSDASTGAQSWLWEFGDGTTSTQQNPQHNYSSVGDYEVCLKVYDSCTVNEYCEVINICVSLVTADFTYTQSGISFQFTDQSATADGWLWDFGNGVTSTLQNPGYYYPGPGNYNVCLIAYELCDQDTFCQQVAAFEAESVEECWANLYDNVTAANGDIANIVTLDSSGNSYVAGSAGEQLVLLKYDAVGNLLWTSIYDSVTYQPQVRDMTIDENGNNFIAATMLQSNGNMEWLVLKFDASGNLVWESWYSSAGINSQDLPKKIHTDPQGNILVAGNNFAHDFFLLKYDSLGDIIWQQSYDFENQPDGLYDMQIDLQGNIYMTGEGLDMTGSSSDGLLIKYNSSGVFQWVRAPGYDIWNWGTMITIDKNQDIYISLIGDDGGSDDLENAHLYKYSPGGSLLWEKHLDEYLNYDLYIAENVGIGVDSANNIYWNVYLIYYEEPTYPDINLTYKYSSTGTLLWNKSYGSALNVFYDAQKMIIEENGSIYLTGSTFTNHFYAYSDSSRIETVKLDSEGNPVWIRLYNNPLGDIPLSLALDQYHNVYVAGYSKTLSGNQFITLKYCTECAADVSLSLVQDTFCFGTSPIALSGGFPSGGIYSGDGVDNNSFDPSTAGPGSHLIYYSFTDSAGCTSVDAQMVFVDICTGSQMSMDNRRFTVFPNPFSESATIQFLLEEESSVEITLFDLHGRKISTLTKGNFWAGNHHLILSDVDLPKGMYLLQLTSEKKASFHKLIRQ